MAEKKTVFVDTCAIIDAVRIGCWADLCGDYSIQTVDEVRKETQRGNPLDTDYVNGRLGRRGERSQVVT